MIDLGESPNVPGPHARHRLDPDLLEKLPSGQAAHRLAAPTLNSPGWHARHPVALGLGAKVPGTHDAHAVDVLFWAK